MNVRNHQKEIVLTMATLRAATQLGLSAATLSRIVGVSATTVHRMQTGKSRFRADSKPAELAALLVRIYVALNRVLGDTSKLHCKWMDSHNRSFNAAPISVMQKVEGLTAVARYVEGTATFEAWRELP
jgi:hypothetical protein